MQETTLAAPTASPAVAVHGTAGLVPVGDADKEALIERANAFASKISSVPHESPAFGEETGKLCVFGQREIAAANIRSSRLLDRPMRSMDGTGGVGADLARLRDIVDRLDPSRDGGPLAPRRILGLFHVGNRARSYFGRYETAQGAISTILRGLAIGKDDLLQDNAAIEGERERMWNAMGRLEQMIYLAAAIDKAVGDRADAIEPDDPGKAKALRETALFNVRQRRQDLLTQMAVTVQGYLALDLVRRNNLELIKAVDRASTTTVAALRTAVVVAQAISGQKLVLDQISALNAAASGMMDGAGEALRAGADRASDGDVPVETLRKAFRNVHEAMDRIDGIKAEAIETMRTTAALLSDRSGDVLRAEE